MLTTFEEPKTTKPKRKAALDTELDNPTLFQTLRELRHTLAKSANVPAYVILSDRSLKELCNAQPKTLLDLADVHGFGKVKVAKFGQQFLDALGTGES